VSAGDEKRLPRAVVWLGVVSFLTDASGEMIYPLLPIFLTTVLKASTGFIGLVEGVAETTASLLKLVSGRLADAMPRKKPLTVAGYGLSSAARPLIAFAPAPIYVLLIRFADRFGKGVRSSPRDALVAEVTPSDRRGAAYGYHRAMDNAGAVVGPLAGFALISGLHVELRTVFAWAALPAALAMAALVFGVREPRQPVAPAAPKLAAGGSAATENGALARYLVAVALFTLSNSSDAFLLVRAGESGFSERGILLLWTAHNATKALLTRGFGALSDRVGRRWLIGAGWLIYAATYFGFGRAHAEWQIWVLFLLYGLYYSLVEGSEKALVADLAGPGRRGRAFGWFNGLTGLLALPASLGFGLVYKKWGAPVAFTAAAALAASSVVALAALVRPSDSVKKER
jgi:MFS family permease